MTKTKTKKAPRKKGARGPYKKKGAKQISHNATNGRANDLTQTFTPLFIAPNRHRSFNGMRLYYLEKPSKAIAGHLYFGLEVSENKFQNVTIGHGSESDMIAVFDEPYFKTQSMELRYKKDLKKGGQISIGAVDYCRQLIEHFNLKPDKGKRIIAYFRLKQIKDSIKNWFVLELVPNQGTVK